MVLRIGPTSSERPVLTAPASVSVQAAQAFLKENEAWLRSSLAARPASIRITGGVTLPYRGGSLTVAPRRSGPMCLHQDQLLVPGEPDLVPVRVAAFLREVARERCAVAADHFAGQLGRRAGRITIRDPRSRWGSCNSAGDLMFSWRLVLMPDAVLEYVVAHEVSHLVCMNHGARFWKVLRDLLPDYRRIHDWLRDFGPDTFRFDFGADRDSRPGDRAMAG